MNNLQQLLKQAGIESPARCLYYFDSQEVWAVTVAGRVALDCWRVLLDSTPQSGLYPVILGEPDEVEEDLLDLDTGDFSPSALIAEASVIDPVEWFKVRVESDPDYYTPLRSEDVEIGEVPDIYTVVCDFESGEPMVEVVLALLPTRHSWEVPAWLGFGGWNDCPDPVEHIAILKRWYDLYGALVTTLSRDTLEMTVKKPPKLLPLELATEHFIYCPDLVLQDTGSLDALAAYLQNRHIWHFWWD